MRHALTAATAAIALLATAPAWAQGQQMTQPSASQNQSQVLQNNGQQPANAREVSPTAPVASENGVTKPQGPTSGPTSQGPSGKSQ
jgi:hypothetical protein